MKLQHPFIPTGCFSVSVKAVAGFWDDGQAGLWDVGYLIMFEHAVDQQRGLLIHLLYDGVRHAVVGLQAGLVRRNAVFIVHVLFGRPESRGTTD